MAASKKQQAGPVDPTSPVSLETLDGVAWLTLDVPGKKVNTLSSHLAEDLDRLLDELAEAQPRGLVIRSGKPDAFVAGADIGELQGMAGREEVRELLSRLHEIGRRLGSMPFPVVAAVHGTCLGGGLELALACDWRAATDHPSTRLGLPEVQLGLIPGWGGTQRLPRLIGVPNALDLILTGKQVPARKAHRLGLVDELCHPVDLGEAALRLVRRGRRAKGRYMGKQGLMAKAGDLLARTPVADRLVFERARDQVLDKTGGHYPAPLRALEVVQEGIKLPLDGGLELEAAAFADLVVGDVAKSLMGIFFMKNDVEKRAAEMAGEGREVSRVAVLGAGLMGAGIAQSLAYKGVPVALKDRDQEALGRGMKYAADRFGELVRRRRYQEHEKRTAMNRLRPTVAYDEVAGADVVIEAVFEDLGVKHQVLRETEAVTGSEAIFASNTSTIPIARIAEGSERPERVVGMHFFSPVHKMPLVEVIRQPRTSPETVATTVRLGRTMGKTIIVVDDGPGFFTSRVLAPYVNEAVWCLAEGATIEQVDQALTGWGWPVGALTLLDEVGLDVGYHAGKVMQEHFGDRFDAPPAFERMLDDDRRGRKAGRGFYVYEKGKKKGADPAVYRLLDWQAKEIPAAEIAERCWLQMLDEVARTIEDGVIENRADIEIGVIFGLGFPPFRGGILRHADRLGLPYVVARLEHYAKRHGDRFDPAPLLRRMAEKGERFHA